MGTQQNHLAHVRAERAASWRDTLPADHEAEPAAPPVRCGEPADVEEFV